MGQYHLTINLDKKEFLDPHKLGDGLKLWEQVNSEGGTMAALMVLLACSNGRGGGDLKAHSVIGRWAGDRLAVVGDYAEDGDLPAEHGAGTLYDQCLSGAFRDISDKVRPAVEAACGVTISGKGWRTKTRQGDPAPRQGIRPDMILTVQPKEDTR